MKKIPLLDLGKTIRVRTAKPWRPVALALLGLTLQGAALAQAPDPARGETVSWTVAPPAADSVKPGGRLALTLRGAVQDGWHVYALKQLENGPTPLRVTLDPSKVATAAGATTGSPATKIHDPAFDLDTQFYSQPFTLTVPVRIAPQAAAGRQLIPLSVRFQTCNGQICQPPKTVRLSVPVNVRTEG